MAYPLSTTSAAPERHRGRGEDLLDGALLALLVFCIFAAERFAVATATLDGIRGQAAKQALREPSWPEAIWPMVAVVGVVVAWLVRKRLIEESVIASATRVDRPRTAADLSLLRFASAVAIVLWAGWQLWGIIAWDDAAPPGALHVAAIVALVVALAAGGHAIGDASTAWERASVVRLHLLVLALLVAVIFLVPLTAAQVSDVLRAWGDGPVSRIGVGISGALLLGAVLRASATRVLIPRQEVGPLGRVSCRGMLVLAAATILGLALLGLLLAAGVVLGLALLASGSRWQTPRQTEATLQPGLRRFAGTLGVAPLAFVFAGLSSALVDTLLLPSKLTRADGGLVATTIVVGVLFAVVAAFSHPHGEPALPRRWVMRAYQAAAGICGLVLAVLAAREGFVGDAAAVALLAVAFALAVRVVPDRGAPQFWGAGGAALGVLLAVYGEPVDASRALGTIGVALLGATALMLGLHLVGTVGQRRVLLGRDRFGWLPAQLPLVGLLLVWGVVAWLVNQGLKTTHQARTVAAVSAPETLEAAVGRWLDREAAGKQQRVPMLLVGASGGGAKAAFWTDLVLDCVFGEGRPPPVERGECAPSHRRDRMGHLFLSSSVSGGSVGIHHLMRHRDPVRPWVDDAAGSEVLSPTVAWGLVHDLPAFLLGGDTDPRRCRDTWSCRKHADRALVQEAAVARFDDGIIPPERQGVLEARREPQRAPVTVFNAALDGADGRVLISPVALAPPRPRNPGCPTPSTGEPAAGSMDAHDVLKARRDRPGEVDQDVPFVTAAVLSARFPVVAPAARLGDARPVTRNGCDDVPPLAPVQLRDGGYVENSGVLTIMELLPAIDRAVQGWKRAHARTDLDVPYLVVSIDDDPAFSEGTPELIELPRQNLGISKRAGPGYLTRLARDRLESCQYPNVHTMRISPAPHLGAQAATGWELSRTVREEDLARALAPGSPEEPPTAGTQVQRLRRLLDSDDVTLRCPPRPEHEEGRVRRQERASHPRSGR